MVFPRISSNYFFSIILNFNKSINPSREKELCSKPPTLLPPFQNSFRNIHKEETKSYIWVANPWSARTVVTSGGVLSEGYGHDRPGVCMGARPEGGRGNTVARRNRRHAAPAYAPIPDPFLVPIVKLNVNFFGYKDNRI